MNDWRRNLDKRDLIHLIESMKSDEQIERDILSSRTAQNKMSSGGRGGCWQCHIIAQRLGLED